MPHRLVGMLRVTVLLLYCRSVVCGQEKGVRIRVENPRIGDVQIRWDDETADGVLILTLGAGKDTIVNSFQGHSFKIAEMTSSAKLNHISSFSVSPGMTFYKVPQDGAVHTSLNDVRTRSLDDIKAAIRAMNDDHKVIGLIDNSPVKRSVPMRVHIVNFRRHAILRYWDPGNGALQYMSTIKPFGREDDVNTYTGHAFVMKASDAAPEAARFVMKYEQRVYVVEPEPDDALTVKGAPYQQHVEYEKFAKEYIAKHGIPWLGGFPAVPPTYPMRSAPAAGLGTIAHSVKLRTHMLLDGVGKASLDLIAISSGPPEGPRAFFIKDLLSKEECDHIVTVSNTLSRSTVNGADGAGRLVQDTRTSEQVWLEKDLTPPIKLMHQRFADVLGISDDAMTLSTELLQVVRYTKGQHYAPHYDYSRENNRIATLLVYIKSPKEGGGTSFPRAFGDRGLKLRPQPGSAVLFYSRLEDGNLDEMSLHAGMPVGEGEKWVCNVWLRAHAKNAESPHRNEL